jgi:hypothetical protein
MFKRDFSFAIQSRVQLCSLLNPLFLIYDISDLGLSSAVVDSWLNYHASHGTTLQSLDIRGNQQRTSSSDAAIITLTALDNVILEDVYSISISVSTINENNSVGDVIGALSATNSSLYNFVYTLVSGTGSIDNASFTITGANLKAGIAFDYETKASYSVRVRATDGALTFDTVFAITINNANDQPTDIALSVSTQNEGSAINSIIGAFSTTDQDTGNTFTYTLVSGTGSTDNASFNISGANLRNSSVFDFETKSSYSIRVRATDQGGLYTEKVFTITVAFVANPFMSATGGTITTDGNYKVHTFNSNGTFTVTGSGNVQALIIGGGGGGAKQNNGGGGGGAGGYIDNGSVAVIAQGYSIVVGDGGNGSTSISANGSNGNNSSAFGLTALGGGGGSHEDTAGLNGGSGGGGGGKTSTGTTSGGTGSQGNNGGQGGYHASGSYRGGGGGGGASSVGANATVGYGGNGGAGTASSITGTSVTRAGGGAGSCVYAGSTGGSGGGGGSVYGSNGGAGTANTGSGGGGADGSHTGGSGGSGVVIIRYQFQ